MRQNGTEYERYAYFLAMGNLKKKKRKKKREKMFRVRNINRYRVVVVNCFVIDLIPTIMYNNCERCSPHLKQRYATLRNFMLQHYPNDWNAIIRRYSKRSLMQG